jgi:SWI/SNF-related matrix-associated actin-dependent regulator 1 of chromatin subfamily A
MESGAGKTVVFAWHHEVMARLAEGLSAYNPVVYRGGMNDAQKKEAIREFTDKNAKVNVFIGQLKAAGTGINGLQTVCNTVVFAELSWVPGEIAQAIDRCHRIGQTRNVVNVYLPHVPGTLESAMLQVHLGKERVISALMSAPSAVNPLEGLI